MYTQLALTIATLRRLLRRFLIRISFIPPFDPADRDDYIRVAAEKVQDKLDDRDIDDFHRAVDAFIINWDMNDSGMNIVQAMSLFSNDEHECRKLYYPLDADERRQIRYGRMFEIIIRPEAIRVAMFITALNPIEKYDEYEYITSGDLNTDRKVRYVDDFTGLLYRVLPELNSYVYNPDRPVVVYKFGLPENHPLRTWCPTSNTSESNDHTDPSR